jgi:integrase
VAIYRRRDGWEVRVYAGVDPVTGKPHRISRQVDGSRRKAEREETKLKAQVMEGRHRGARAKTVAELVDTFLDWREGNDKPIGPRTIQGYRSLAEARIKPGLGKLRLPQLDAPTLDRFYAALRKSGSLRKPGEPLSASRLRDVHAVISGALALAARYGWLAYNPATLVKPPTSRGTKRPMPTKAEARAALQAAAAKDPELYLFLRLGATTGLRPGEVCALWWRDFDLDAGELLVGYNVVHAKGLPDGYVRKRTKSVHGDDRPIALGAGTTALLREHRARCEARARELGGELAPDAYVFSTDEAGRRPLRVDTMTRRFGELAKQLGHGYTLYGFRHFVATQLGAVATTATIRERIGHGSLQVAATCTGSARRIARPRATWTGCWTASPSGRTTDRHEAKPDRAGRAGGGWSAAGRRGGPAGPETVRYGLGSRVSAVVSSTGLDSPVSVLHPEWASGTVTQGWRSGSGQPPGPGGGGVVTAVGVSPWGCHHRHPPLGGWVMTVTTPPSPSARGCQRR